MERGGAEEEEEAALNEHLLMKASCYRRQLFDRTPPLPPSLPPLLHVCMVPVSMLAFSSKHYDPLAYQLPPYVT